MSISKLPSRPLKSWQTIRCQDNGGTDGCIHAEDVDAMVKKVLDTFGRIDILVNNAGVTRDNLMLRMKDERVGPCHQHQSQGCLRLYRSVARHMAKARKGNIINIASVVGQMGNAGQANYTASKGGVIALTKTTARSLPAGMSESMLLLPVSSIPQ